MTGRGDVGEPETLTIVILRTITCIFYVVTSLVRILSVTSSCCNVMVKEILANVSSQQFILQLSLVPY